MMNDLGNNEFVDLGGMQKSDDYGYLDGLFTGHSGSRLWLGFLGSYFVYPFISSNVAFFIMEVRLRAGQFSMYTLRIINPFSPTQ